MVFWGGRELRGKTNPSMNANMGEVEWEQSNTATKAAKATCYR